MTSKTRAPAAPPAGDIPKLPKCCSLKHIVLGKVFNLPDNPNSNVSVEYRLVIDVPASASSNGRRQYVNADIIFTAAGLATVAQQTYEHARATANSMLATMLAYEEPN